VDGKGEYVLRQMKRKERPPLPDFHALRHGTAPRCSLHTNAKAERVSCADRTGRARPLARVVEVLEAVSEGTRSRRTACHREGMSVRRVVPDFQADDPAASVEFYREVLGLEVAMDHGWIVTFAAPDNPAAQISVMRQDASASVQPDASIEVDDVDAAHAAARRLGYEIVHPLTDEPWGVRRFFVREPNGKVLNVLSHP
jgi:predicted enzyme related to lactoylglutathione lyase